VIDDLHELEAEEAVRRVVEPLLAQGADQLVLGCTHYPFLADTLKKVIGCRKVALVDPAPAIAQRVTAVLHQRNALAGVDHPAKYDYFSSGDEAYLRQLKDRGRLILRQIAQEKREDPKT
jgi:glutamate racemase